MNKTKKKSNNKRKTVKKYLIKYAKNRRTRKSKMAAKRNKIIGGSKEDEKLFNEIYTNILVDYDFEKIKRLIDVYKPIITYVGKNIGMRLIELALAVARKDLVSYIIDEYPNIANLKVNKTGGNLLSFYLAMINPEVHVVFHYDIFKLLVDNTSDVNNRDNTSKTAIFYAVYINNGFNIQCIDYLLQKGADINCKDEINNTPLFYAIILKNTEMVKVILEKGGKETINDENKNGETALYVAITHTVDDIIKLLLDNGAIVDNELIEYAIKINTKIINTKITNLLQNAKKIIDANELLIREKEARKKEEELLKELDNENKKKAKKKDMRRKKKLANKKDNIENPEIIIERISSIKNPDMETKIFVDDNENQIGEKDNIEKEINDFKTELGFDVEEEGKLKTELEEEEEGKLKTELEEGELKTELEEEEEGELKSALEEKNKNIWVDETEILNFWGSYFQDYEIQKFKNNILGFIHNNSSRYFLQSMLPAYNNTYNDILNTTSEKNKYIDNILSALFIFIGFLSYHLNKQGIKLILKGGSAVQHIGSNLPYYQYTSNDIDVILLSSPEGITKKEFAEKICKLIEWIMQDDDDGTKKKHVYHCPNKDSNYSIYKIILNEHKIAVIDIDYNNLEEDIERLYLGDNMFSSTFYIGDNYHENDSSSGNCLFYSQNQFSFIIEKINYLIKYTSGDGLKNPKNRGFLHKIHKSMKYFCLNQLQQDGYDQYDHNIQYWYYKNIFSAYFTLYQKDIDDNRVHQLILIPLITLPKKLLK